MVTDAESLIDNYVKWIKEKIDSRNVGDEWIEITTPFLDRHNDHVQIYVQQRDGEYILTDDGYTINDLEISGCSLNTPKRKALLYANINGFGVKLNGNAIEVIAEKETFGQKKHNLLQAILSVNDLFYTAQANVESLFLEDVSKWLDSNDVRYTPDVIFPGNSGIEHRYNFVIPKSKKCPERILQTINHPTKDNAELFVFSWIDTKQERPGDSMAYIALNDAEKNVSQSIIKIFSEYQIEAFPFSKRNDVIDGITA